jgi:transposase
MDTMEHATRKKVRQHPAALRQQVLMQCAQPGASVARVALAHGLNANLVHAWRQQERIAPVAPGAGTAASAAQFIALQMPASAPAALPNIRIELRRGATTVSVSWPGQAASECGAWLCEWLRDWLR